jgi:hypothetical protein
MRVIDQLSELWLFVYVATLLAGATGATIFPLLYAFMVRWWETPMGRYMMYKGVVLAMSLDLVAARLFIPSLPIWTSFAVLGAIAIMVWWYTILFLLTYYRGRNKRREDRQRKKAEHV